MRMTERLAKPHETTFEHLKPEDLTDGELQGMKRLYSHDAVEAYAKVVGDENTKDQLKDYFGTKAEKLSDALLDPNQRFWLAEKDGRVIGMAGYNVERRLIHSVYIADDVRGQGVGSDLMQCVIRETRDVPRTVLVASANTRAIEFYERLGFKPNGKVKEWKIGGVSIPELELEITESNYDR